MKKKIIISVCVAAAAAACSAALLGCDGGQKEYVIQYTYDGSTYQITVEKGMPYALDTVPEKTGYTFTGLFDAETGGTQYVSAAGASLSPFTGGKNLVLFPQFKANEYTVILDYQGASVTGDRQFTVSYGSSLPELPKDLVSEHKDFSGWYTAANCEGVRVADEYGLVPIVSVLTEDNFDVSLSNITLYAGFEWEKFTVTCHFKDGTDTEELRIEYDTPVGKIVPETRVNGEAPLTWSKTRGGEAFNGKITEDTDLYALEYAPVIELDSNGGSKVAPVVARAGSTVALPTPTKDMAKFAYWEDMQGNKFTATTMPSKSVSLKAVWQAKLVFDSNGGTNVDDISVAAGEKITLPAPEREGFIFAGWYTSDKELYNSTTMPSSGIKLKAGWYKTLTKNVVEIQSTSSISSKINRASVNSACYSVKYNEYFSGNTSMNVRIRGHFQIKSSWADHEGKKSAFLEVYSQRSISSAYLLDKKTFHDVTGEYRSYDFDISVAMSDDIYMCWYHECPYTSWDFQLSDLYYTIFYPDTTNLYL